MNWGGFPYFWKHPYPTYVTTWDGPKAHTPKPKVSHQVRHLSFGMQDAKGWAERRELGMGPKKPVINGVSYTLPETNMAPENGWLEYDRFLLGWPIFRGYVSFRECNPYNLDLYTSPRMPVALLKVCL